MKKTLTLLSLILLTACSSGHKKTTTTRYEMPRDLSDDIVSMELFLNRSSTSEQEFEQLKVVNDKIYVECGRIEGGRVTPITQTLEEASPQKLAYLFDDTASMITDLQTDPRTFARPGNSNSFSDPGRFFLTVTTGSKIYKIRTSLDSISEPETTPEKNLKTIAGELRGLANGKLCGNNSFYGIQATDPQAPKLY